ncbi:MAG: chemotaxis protein CheW [Herminiimonas sp.]|uniref:chemotaxis protein CheW n=1 Tax=Herminiimonas sp. TaxID=1926289 RepID=UPI002720E408|nr:chemotaxis protein CheW [Herminiimonas sp.]MDO9419430.1 chemotaxis protein CheW [Herminiimonas sp.]
MANRQALRELQSRLADRLQAAKTQGVTASWLAVEAGDGKYLFPLNQSGEIFPWVGAQNVPYTQAWFAGVANLRGGLYGIVDLASFVTGKVPPPRSELARTESRLVALNSALEINCALQIDKLTGLRHPEEFTDFSEKLPESPEFFGHSYVDANGDTWQEINLQSLAQQAHFLTISA